MAVFTCNLCVCWEEKVEKSGHSWQEAMAFGTSNCPQLESRLANKQTFKNAATAERLLSRPKAVQRSISYIGSYL